MLLKWQAYLVALTAFTIIGTRNIFSESHFAESRVSRCYSVLSLKTFTTPKADATSSHSHRSYSQPMQQKTAHTASYALKCKIIGTLAIFSSVKPFVSSSRRGFLPLSYSLQIENLRNACLLLYPEHSTLINFDSSALRQLSYGSCWNINSEQIEELLPKFRS